MALNYCSTNLVSYDHCRSLARLLVYGFRATGEFMDKKHSRSSDPKESKPPSEPEIDYSPKPTTLGENLRLGVKMFAIAALIVGLFWIMEKYIF